MWCVVNLHPFDDKISLTLNNCSHASWKNWISLNWDLCVRLLARTFSSLHFLGQRLNLILFVRLLHGSRRLDLFWVPSSVLLRLLRLFFWLLLRFFVDSELGIGSGFDVGSSCTGAGSDNRMFVSHFSLSDTARKSWPIHTSYGYGGSAEDLPQNEGTPSSSVLSSEQETAGCAMWYSLNFIWKLWTL